MNKPASEWDIENKRKWTALKISAQTGLDYNKVLCELQDMGVHENWTEWELLNRPVDIDELSEIILERIGD